MVATGPADLRDSFFGWQCRLRQLSIRQHGGEPTSGMRPGVATEPGGSLGQIVVLIIKRDASEFVAQFKHMYQRTRDPADRHDSALEFLAAAYYQRPQEFADELTALFGPNSPTAARLVEAGRCTLEFEQFSQRYVIPCAVRDIPIADPAHQVTFWHNSLFNPELPPGVRVLGFTPRWWTIATDTAGRG